MDGGAELKDRDATTSRTSAPPPGSRRTAEAPGGGREGGDEDAAGDGATEATGRRPRRRLLLVPLALAVVAGLGWFAWHYWTVGRFVETTDNAYIRADIVDIAARVEGRVAAVPVADNERVGAGHVLTRIDDREYRAALMEREADIAAARAALANIDERVRLQRAEIDAASADVRSAEAANAYARAENERYRALARRESGSVQRAQEASSRLEQATASLAKARASLERERQQLNVLASEREQQDASLARAQAERTLAEIDLDDTVIRSPEAGAVGNKGVEVGEYVQPGQMLMSLVPLSDVYVVANFKETQIGAFRAGMPASVEVDTFGDREIEGHIDSLAPASGAEFSVIPPDNATGNFTKIVQRIPIKIRLDVPEALRGALRPGSSVVVSVDTAGGP